MPVPLFIEQGFYHFTDALFASIPQKKPSPERLAQTKLIAHRGERDNQTVFENSLAAFRPYLRNKIFGIEFDLRWTRDFVPIISHDADAKRLFNDTTILANLSFAECRQLFPAIASLQEMVDNFGKQLHLMIEIKDEPYPDAKRQSAIIKEILKPLTPIEDYHFISLRPELFKRINFAPTATYAPIAELAIHRTSQLVFSHAYNNLLAHYAVLPRSLIKRHLAAGHHLGTGQIHSKNCLYREINRGVEWIFSNSPLKLKAFLS